MTATPKLNLPYIAPAQSQKHVTHNQALRVLDAVVQLSVVNRTSNAPPAAVSEGDSFLVAANPTGAWAGYAGSVAVSQDGAWTILSPRVGWTAWVAAEAQAVTWDGTAWRVSSGQGVPAGGTTGQLLQKTGAADYQTGWVTLATLTQNLPGLGVNASSDATNKLAVRSSAVLFDNIGNGVQAKLNKKAATDTASLLFQSNYAGRAEMGTTGDDNFHLKVSADGSAWRESLVIDAATGTAMTARLQPMADNAYALGAAGQRWSTIFAASGVVTSSDARDKEVVGSLAGRAGAIVDSVDPIIYRWLVSEWHADPTTGALAPTPGQRLHAGFRAQDVKQALEAVELPIAAWGLTDPADATSRQWLRPDELIPVLWQAVRELRVELTRLSAMPAGNPGK